MCRSVNWLLRYSAAYSESMYIDRARRINGWYVAPHNSAIKCGVNRLV